MILSDGLEIKVQSRPLAPSYTSFLLRDDKLAALNPVKSIQSFVRGAYALKMLEQLREKLCN